jgi:hypothetical protein
LAIPLQHPNAIASTDDLLAELWATRRQLAQLRTARRWAALPLSVGCGSDAAVAGSLALASHRLYLVKVFTSNALTK